LKSSALVLFEIAASCLFSKLRASGIDFQNTGLC